MEKFPPAAQLDAERIRCHLGAQAGRFELCVVEQCESTNAVLLAEPAAADDRVRVLVCERQTHGRGRRGREWLSWGEASLTFSIRWQFRAGAPVPAGLSLVAGLALARTIEGLGAERIQLKWPNDVLFDGRKLAGILVELTQGRDRGAAAVIGVGINLRLPQGVAVPGDVPVADLARVLREVPDRNQLLALLLLEFQSLLETYAVGGFPALRGAWEQRNAHAGQAVRIGGEGVEIEGLCLGVDDDGALRVHTAHGVRRVLSGEVSLRPVA